MFESESEPKNNRKQDKQSHPTNVEGNITLQLTNLTQISTLCCSFACNKLQHRSGVEWSSKPLCVVWLLPGCHSHYVRGYLPQLSSAL